MNINTQKLSELSFDNLLSMHGYATARSGADGGLWNDISAAASVEIERRFTEVFNEKIPMNFVGVAVKCDTWEQMQMLAEEAERQGYKEWMFEEIHFNKGMPYFVLNDEQREYTNICDDELKLNDFKVIPFTDFYKP